MSCFQKGGYFGWESVFHQPYESSACAVGLARLVFLKIEDIEIILGTQLKSFCEKLKAHNSNGNADSNILSDHEQQSEQIPKRNESVPEESFTDTNFKLQSILQQPPKDIDDTFVPVSGNENNFINRQRLPQERSEVLEHFTVVPGRFELDNETHNLD